MADTLARSSGESRVTAAKHKFPTAELEGAQVCFERDREGETCPGDFSLTPRVWISSTFVV